MSVAVAELPASRRLRASRVVAALALSVLVAGFVCAGTGYVLVRRADDRQDLERRAALLGAIADIRNSGADFAALDPRHLRGLERAAGLGDLRFELEPEPEPAVAGREVQSVLDRDGRIIGWLSWRPVRSLGPMVDALWPLWLTSALLLVGFCGVALWQMRRALRDLGATEEMAWRLAHQDPLTGLPNHRQMVTLIERALAARAADEVLTLAYFDLDGLKDVNDAHGRSIGDALLIALATRLRDILPDGGCCGRCDGDEFAVLLGTGTAEAGTSAVEAMAGALARPYWIEGQAVQVGITAGLAQVPGDAETHDALMRRAGLALRAAKRGRRGGMVRFKPAMNAEFADRRFLERELKRALDDDALEVHYQPIVSADGARIVGAEALARWTHPERGAIAPAEFVPMAEQCGLMPRLGDLVLRRSLADAVRWPDLYVSVNLSPLQMRDPALFEQVARGLAEAGLPAARLMLEVTEGVLIDNPAEAQARLDRLKALGVKLALDDFGTGYSSLTYLQRFKFDKLKIDRGFVAPLGRNARSNALVQAIVTLGRALDLALLAEGVETEEQRVLLRLAGCDELQGFLFGAPAPRDDFERLVANAAPGFRAAMA